MLSWLAHRVIKDAWFVVITWALLAPLLAALALTGLGGPSLAGRLEPEPASLPGTESAVGQQVLESLAGDGAIVTLLVTGVDLGSTARQEDIAADLTATHANLYGPVEAWERSGQELDRVSSVFYNLLPTISDDELEEIGAWVAPLLAAHNDWVYLNEELYRRVCAVTAPDDPESQRLHTKLLDEFRRRGATLSPADKEKLVAINERLSVLSEEFSRTQLNVTKELAVHVADAAELAGMSAERIAAAEEYAREVGKDGYVIPLEIQTIHSEISTLEVPKTRQRLLEASLARREATGDILVEMVQLRAQRAELLGFASHADYVIAEETAKESSAVWDFLRSVAPNAATNARHEFKLIEELADSPVGAADWQYWESRVRARDFAIDEDELIKYFPLERRGVP